MRYPRGDLQADGRAGLRWLHQAHEVLARQVAPAEAMLLYQALPDRLIFDPLPTQRQDGITEGFDTRSLVGWTS